MEAFLRTKVERWRGKPPRRRDYGVDDAADPDDGKVESDPGETELTHLQSTERLI